MAAGRTRTGYLSHPRGMSYHQTMSPSTTVITTSVVTHCNTFLNNVNKTKIYNANIFKTWKGMNLFFCENKDTYKISVWYHLYFLSYWNISALFTFYMEKTDEGKYGVWSKFKQNTLLQMNDKLLGELLFSK